MDNNESTMLIGKNILCIIPNFFGYDSAIVSALEKCGAHVDLLHDRPFTNSIMKALVRRWPKLFYRISEWTYNKQLAKLDRGSYDYVLIVVGLTVSPRYLQYLRANYQKAKFIYYTWDSIKNRPMALKLARLCDRRFTFDPVDSEFTDLKLRPLFFLEDTRFQSLSNPYEKSYCYKICFIATLHSDRYQVFKKIIKQLPKDTTKFQYIYVPSKPVLIAYRFLLPGVFFAKNSEFSFTTISKNELMRAYAESEIIIDIEHPDQTGLTMRTLEALGAGKKIITTNVMIEDCDFYSPLNHLIISRDSPVIPSAFLTTKYTPPTSSILQKYTLQSWLNEIFFDRED